MRPPTKGNIEYERIQKYDEWIPGHIDEIRLEENRLTGFMDEKTKQPKRADMVRFKFALEGHSYPHYSRWMSYSFGEKANLFKKYLKHLVADAQPDMDFDLDLLKGFKVKTMWTANGDFDNLEQIRPLGVPFPRQPFEGDSEPAEAEDELAEESGGKEDPDIGF